MANGRRKHGKDDDDVPLTLQHFREEISRMKEELRTNIVNDVIKVLKEEINDMKEKIAVHDKDIENIKSYVINLESERLRMERKALVNNIVVKGLPEDPDETVLVTESKVNNLLSAMNVDVKILMAERVGNKGKSRLIKIITGSRHDRNTILTNSKQLQNNVHYQNVYLSADRPFLDRKEAARLRVRRKELAQQHPQANVRIRRGKLFLNDEEIDKEYPLRQLFPID